MPDIFGTGLFGDGTFGGVVDKLGFSVRGNSITGGRGVQRALPEGVTLADHLGETYLVGYGRTGLDITVLRPDTTDDVSEMGLVAVLNVLPPALPVQPNMKYLTPVLLKYRSRLSNLRVRLDTFGGRADGTALARPVVYDEHGNLVIEGLERTFAANLPQQWVAFTFRAPPCYPGTYYVGLHVGGDPGMLRIQTLIGGITRAVVDTYADGAEAALGTVAESLNALSIFLFSFPEYVAPIETDRYYGRLPLVEAQAKLGEKAAAGKSKRLTCGWHHLVLDPEVGSFAIVNENGPLADFVGRRLSVRLNGKHVVAYVHRADSTLFDNLSLTRLLFAQLGDVAEDFFKVEVWDVTI